MYLLQCSHLGEYFDAETGTIYLRARYYDPTIGRFISRDSYAGKKEDPLSLNLYTYCHNNPIIYIDIDGHKASFKKIYEGWCETWGKTGEQIYDINNYFEKSLTSSWKLGADTIESETKNKVMESAITHRVTVMALQKNIGKQNGVVSIGMSLSGTVMSWNAGVSGSIVADTQGNVAIQTTKSKGNALDILSGSFSIPISYTHAPSIINLEKNGSAVGTTLSASLYGILSGGITADITTAPNQDVNYHGKTVAPSIGLSQGILGFFEMHINEGYTDTKKEFNIYDMYYKTSNRVLEWAKN